MNKTTLLPMLLLLAAPAGAQESAPEPTPAAEPTSTPVPGSTRKPSLGGGPATELPRGTSLADVVRKSQGEKVEKKRSLGVITNETLKGGSGSGKGGTLNLAPKSPSGSRTAPNAASGAGSAAPPPAPSSTEARDDKGRSEADWKKIVQRSQERVEKAEGEAKRLDDEVRKLENDFYAWSDGNYRDGVIKPTLDKAREDLKKARLNLDQAQAANADLEEDARKSNTPPGWLRQK